MNASVRSKHVFQEFSGGSVGVSNVLLVKRMDQDVVNRVNEEAFECRFDIFVAVEFIEFDSMESFDGGNLWACGCARELWELAWVGWFDARVTWCSEGICSGG